MSKKEEPFKYKDDSSSFYCFGKSKRFLDCPYELPEGKTVGLVGTVAVKEESTSNLEDIKDIDAVDRVVEAICTDCLIICDHFIHEDGTFECLYCGKVTKVGGKIK